MRMIQRGQDFGFPAETAKTLGIAREFGRQDFDCDLAFELGVAGSIDLAHPACPERAQDLIRADVRTGLERGHVAYS